MKHSSFQNIYFKSKKIKFVRCKFYGIKYEKCVNSKKKGL